MPWSHAKAPTRAQSAEETQRISPGRFAYDAPSSLRGRGDLNSHSALVSPSPVSTITAVAAPATTSAAGT